LHERGDTLHTATLDIPGKYGLDILKSFMVRIPDADLHD